MDNKSSKHIQNVTQLYTPKYSKEVHNKRKVSTAARNKDTLFI